MKNSLLFIAILLMSSSIFAQDIYELRFNHHHTDCAKQLLYVDIEVKAATPNTTVHLADQNYRFSFDKEVLSNPKLVKELTVSGMTNSNGHSSLYDAHNLRGSMNDIVSYNVVLTGGAGYPINNTAWTSVGRISFEIADVDKAVELTWHDNKPENFPPTFISEKTSNGDLKAATSHHMSNFSKKEVCAVSTLDEQVQISELFPNPVSNNDTNITIEFTNDFATTKSTLLVTSIDGSVVAEQFINLTEGFNSIQFNTQKLATGVYMVQINDALWQSKTIKFVKVD